MDYSLGRGSRAKGLEREANEGGAALNSVRLECWLSIPSRNRGLLPMDSKRLHSSESSNLTILVTDGRTLDRYDRDIVTLWRSRRERLYVVEN